MKMKFAQIKSNFPNFLLSIDEVVRIFEKCSVVLGILLGIAGEADALPQSVQRQLDSNITSLTPIELKMGVNAVHFWGEQNRYCDPKHEINTSNDIPKCRTEVQDEGVIIKLENPYQYLESAYISYIIWKTPYDLLALNRGENQSEGGNYLIQDESFMGFADVRSVMFFQGIIDGHKETFIASASRIPSGEAPFMGALPVKISIYGFSAGTPASYSYSFAAPPHFYKIQEYITLKKYYDSKLALASELAIVVPKSGLPKN